MIHITPYYFCDETVLPERPVIMHIGGDPATCTAIRRHWPDAEIIVVEANAARCVDPLVMGADTVIHAALTQCNGPITLYLYKRTTASSLWRRPKFGEPVETHEVEGCTLKTLMEDRGGVLELDLLLMNCEGAELFALMEIAVDAGLYARVRQICMATHCHRFPVYTQERLDWWLKRMEAEEGFDITREYQNGLEYVHLQYRRDFR